MDAVMARRGPPCGAVHTVNSLRPTVRTGAAIPTIHGPTNNTITTTTITDNTSIARRHKDSNKRGPSTCDRACAVIRSRLAGTTAVHVARTEAPSRTRLATCAGQVHATRHSNIRCGNGNPSIRAWQRPPAAIPVFPRHTWTRGLAALPIGDARARYQCAVTPTRTERDARPSQSQHSGRSCTQGRGGAIRQEGLPLGELAPTADLHNDHRHANMRPRTALVAVTPRFSGGQARTTRQRFEPDGRPHATSPTS